MRHEQPLQLMFTLKLAITIIVWQFISYLLRIKYLPSPLDLSHSLIISLLHGNLIFDTLITLYRIILGFLYASIVGVATGIVLGHFPLISKILDLPFHFMRSLPPPIFIPMGIILFGWNSSSRVAIIVIGSCWPIIINTIEGIRNMDKQWLYIAKQFDYGRLGTIIHVVIPGTLPQIFTGLKISLSIVIIMVLISEMILTSTGLGYYIVFAQRSFNINNLYVGIMISGWLGYFLNAILQKIENTVIRWHKVYEADQSIHSVARNS